MGYSVFNHQTNKLEGGRGRWDYSPKNRAANDVVVALVERVSVPEFGADGDDLLLVFREGVTFETLSKISEIFGGTKALDVGSEDRQGGYCETCAYSYSVAVVNVRGKASEVFG